MTNPTARLLTASEAESAARVISKAFMDDPLIRFMLPFKPTRFRTMYKYFRPMTEISIHHGKVSGVGEPLQGVAYWKSPEQKPMSVSLKNLGQFLPLLLTLYPLGFLRARKLLEKTETMHAQYASEPHFYLENLGVSESARGQGFSSQLLCPILDRADEQQVTVYTDTTNPANVPLYEHFGFKCVEAAAFPDLGLAVFALHRPIQ